MRTWKKVPIPEYADFYMVSNRGDVYSVRKRRLLKSKKNEVGYLRVGLSVDGKVKMFAVHRLVALAFVPNPYNKPTVNHINEIKTDNRVENLEWATTYEQNVHGTRISRAVSHTDYKKRGIDYMEVARKHDYTKQTMCNRKIVDVWMTKDGESVFVGRFMTHRKAAAYTGVSAGKVSSCVLGKIKSCKGYVFKEEESNGKNIHS